MVLTNLSSPYSSTITFLNYSFKSEIGRKYTEIELLYLTFFLNFAYINGLPFQQMRLKELGHVPPLHFKHKDKNNR